MELWVRTQHKMALIKSNGVYFKEERNDFTDGSKVKWCFYDYSSDEAIATYDSKDRCLEILDGIQKILSDTILLVNDSGKQALDNIHGNAIAILNGNEKIEQLGTYVYQMPEK